MITKRFTFLFLISLLITINFSYAGQLLYDEVIKYFNEGVQAQKNGNFEKANTAYKKVLLLDPNFDSKLILNNVGIMSVQKGDLDKAEESFNAALQIDPHYKEAQMNLGLVYDRGKDRLKALEYWSEILNIDTLKPISFIMEDKRKVEHN